jgi:hypothetical protein
MNVTDPPWTAFAGVGCTDTAISCRDCPTLPPPQLASTTIRTAIPKPQKMDIALHGVIAADRIKNLDFLLRLLRDVFRSI